jgi:hypothetical protein
MKFGMAQYQFVASHFTSSADVLSLFSVRQEGLKEPKTKKEIALVVPGCPTNRLKMAKKAFISISFLGGQWGLLALGLPQGMNLISRG